jgi:hypothetical protein
MATLRVDFTRMKYSHGSKRCEPLVLRRYQQSLQSIALIGLQPSFVRMQVAITRQGMRAMNNVDPIRYVWKCCNVHVPFPAALGRSATTSSVASSVSNAHADPTLARRVAGVEEAQAALLSFVVGDTTRRLAERSSPSVTLRVLHDQKGSGCPRSRRATPGCASPGGHASVCARTGSGITSRIACRSRLRRFSA